MAIVQRLTRDGELYWTEDGTEPLGMQRTEECTDVQIAERTVPASKETITLVTAVTSGRNRRPIDPNTQERTKTDMAATLPALTDTTPLIEEFAPQRSDFDEIRRQVAKISVQSMTATLAGQERADQLMDWDHRAKQFIDGFRKAIQPMKDALNEAVRRQREFENNMIGSAIELRNDISVRTSAYSLNVQRKVDDERRALERQQREQAEAQRAAQLAELREREAAARKEAQNTAGDAAAVEEAAREAERLAAEASEVAAAPPVPAAVSTTALAERYKVQGQSGTRVFVRTIKHAIAAGQFLTWAGKQGISVTHPLEKRNSVILRVAGIELIINFAGLRKADESVQIPGVEVSATYDSRNLRK